MSDKYKKQEKTPGILARLRKVAGLNIGTIMFGILFIYMSFSAILYFTTTHIESYQVTSGPLSRNETYTGLAIREETVCTAPSSGYITYYAREGSKINASGAVYGLSSIKKSTATASLTTEAPLARFPTVQVVGVKVRSPNGESQVKSVSSV